MSGPIFLFFLSLTVLRTYSQKMKGPNISTAPNSVRVLRSGSEIGPTNGGRVFFVCTEADTLCKPGPYAQALDMYLRGLQRHVTLSRVEGTEVTGQGTSLQLEPNILAPQVFTYLCFKCAPVCMYVHMHVDVNRSQKRVSGSLSWSDRWLCATLCMLRVKLWSSEEQQALTHGAISPASCPYFWEVGE